MIELEALSKRFGAIDAVRDVSLHAADGRITGLLGPNGAGKSTTLRLLYGVLRPDAGRALIDGIDMAKDPVAALGRLGVLPHNAGIYPQLTARENIRYFGRLLGLGGATLERRIDELTELLEMREFAERRAKGFSQGRGSASRSPARSCINPRIWCSMSRPTASTCSRPRSLRELILRLKDAGHAVLFSSHVMQEVTALCDEIVIIGSGRVVAKGTPAELNRTVASGSLEDAFVAALERGTSG